MYLLHNCECNTSIYCTVYLAFAELMQLADKNCENDLKKRCETLIIRGITTDNVLNLITMATNLKLQVKMNCSCKLN